MHCVYVKGNGSSCGGARDRVGNGLQGAPVCKSISRVSPFSSFPKLKASSRGGR